MTTLMTTPVITPANLRSRSGKVHARLEPGSDRFYCRSSDPFAPLIVEATDDPVTCRHCRTRRGHTRRALSKSDEEVLR
jgi:hypothetical protein